MNKKIIVIADTEASNEDLKKAFLSCGLVDIKSVEVEDEKENN